jgi:hypothetical protein
VPGETVYEKMQAGLQAHDLTFEDFAPALPIKVNNSPQISRKGGFFGRCKLRGAIIDHSVGPKFTCSFTVINPPVRSGLSMPKRTEGFSLAFYEFGYVIVYSYGMQFTVGVQFTANRKAMIEEVLLKMNYLLVESE